MILIEESLFSVGGSTSVSKIKTNIVRSDANVRVRNFCDRIREQIGDDFCQYHPDYVCTIVIGASETKDYFVKEVDFCCQSFQNSIEFLANR